jgi:acyl-CoA synthetase (AMP-forming)/AMP-acid ligase II
MITINPPITETPPSETVVARIRTNAQTHTDRLALVCGEDCLSWGAFNTRINRTANLLLQLGLHKGDNVAIISPNSIAYAELFMGILRAGGCVTPLSSMASTEALQKMLTDCDARAIFVAAQYLDLVSGFLTGLPMKRFAIDFEHPDFDDYEGALAVSPTIDPMIPIDMADPFNLIYSSGTTGTPKGIVQNHWMRAAQMERVSPNR